MITERKLEESSTDQDWVERYNGLVVPIEAVRLTEGEELEAGQEHTKNLGGEVFRWSKRIGIPLFTAVIAAMGVATPDHSDQSHDDNFTIKPPDNLPNFLGPDLVYAQGENCINPADRPFNRTICFNDSGREIFIGTRTSFGEPPNNPNDTIGTGDVWINRSYTHTFQLYGPWYPEISPGGGGYAVIDSLVWNPTHRLLYAGVAMNIFGRYYVRGGQILKDIDDPANYSKRLQITSESIADIETDGNFSPLSFIDGAQSYLQKDLRNALSPARRGLYRKSVDPQSGLPTGIWVMISETPTPIVIMTATSSPTRLEVTPTPSATLQRSPTPTETTGISGIRTVSLSGANPIEFGWQDINGEAGYAVIRFYNNQTEVAGLLPANTTVYRDQSITSGLACYMSLPFGLRGEILGMSNMICVLAGSRSVTGAPDGVIAALNNNMTRFSFTLNPQESRALAVLASTPQVISIPDGVNSVSDDTLGSPKGYSLLSLRNGQVSGNSNFFFVLPGIMRP